MKINKIELEKISTSQIKEAFFALKGIPGINTKMPRTSRTKEAMAEHLVNLIHDLADKGIAASIPAEVDELVGRLDMVEAVEKSGKPEKKPAKVTMEDRIIQNGVKRPNPDGLCGQAWAIFDSLAKQRNGEPFVIGDALKIASGKGLNLGNVRTELTYWKKFHGIRSEPRITKKSIVVEMLSKKKGATLDEMGEAMTKAGLGDFERNKATAKLWLPKIGFKVEKVGDRYIKA